MEPSELESNLEIIFEKEIHDLAMRLPTYTVAESKDGRHIEYANGETLIALFSTIKNDAELKPVFLYSLIRQITDHEEVIASDSSSRAIFIGTAPLGFYTLVSLGFVNEAIDSLRRRKKGCRGIFKLISLLIPMNCFDKSQLKEIGDKLKIDAQYMPVMETNYLVTMIINSRFELLKKQIKAVNVEINQDKKTVSEKIYLLGFESKYKELLDGIDQFLNTETLNIVNAGMISNLRTFMGNLLDEIANKIAEKEKEPIPKIEGCSEMGNVRKYLKKKLELSDNDDKFIDSFVNILHSEGGHSFTSDKEYFRLARNIAIEIALFVLSKYERKFKS